MSVLRVYSESECDAAGVPLDWESLKPLVLAELLWGFTFDAPPGPGMPVMRRVPRFPDGARCEDCGHPMSDGAWESHGGWASKSESLLTAEDELRAGREPERMSQTHYSECDEGCRHNGEHDQQFFYKGLTVSGNRPGPRRSSWRPVGVRCLSHAHDLRGESLAVLCLRCFVVRPRL